MKTVILGSGSWGTALAQVLCDNGNEAVIWGIDSTEIEDIQNNHRNSRFFETEIHPDIQATYDLSVIKDADIVLLAVPTKALEGVLERISPLIEKPVILINVAKGFHPDTHERLSEVIRRNIPKEKRKAVVSLIGPSHAEEVILRKLTAINAVSTDETSAKTIQHLFANEYFRVYTNTDEIGCEIGVAVKNVIAIASGILEGLAEGDNAKAALITRGLAEITRFGICFGAKKETYLGLDGVGDLIVTCMSKHSRNFMAGYAIGQADSAEEFMRTNTKTVEGIFAAKAVKEMADQYHIEMPITNEVYAVLYENKKPREAVVKLMTRELKSEKVMRRN